MKHLSPKRSNLSVLAVFCLASLVGHTAHAENVVVPTPEITPVATPTQTPTPQQLRSGRALMTPEEHAAQRDRMRNATSIEERDRLHREHHAQMQQRAQEQGLTLPDMPQAQGNRRNNRSSSGGMGRGMGEGCGR